MNKKPLISFCLFTYNQEKYIKKAIESALNQTYSPLEIIINDDCSTDKTFDIVKSAISNYQGSHKIIHNRNEVNLGLVPSVNNILYNYVQGDYIVMAAGDDISCENRVLNLYEVISKKEDLISVSSSLIYINADGVKGKKSQINSDKEYDEYSLIDYLERKVFHLNAHRIFKRTVLDVFDPLDIKCPTEDTTIFLRCLLLGNVAINYKYDVLYRIHSESISHDDNIFKLDYKKIYNQYNRDIEVAFLKKIISKHVYGKLLKKTKVYLSRQSLSFSLYERSSWLLVCLTIVRVCFSFNFTFKEKKNILKRNIFPIIKNIMHFVGVK